MKEQQVALEAAIQADIPVVMWGPPGIGKTAIAKALAKRRGAHMETLIGSTMDPADIARPVVDQDGNLRMVAAPFARRIRAALDAGQEAFLFLDELGSVSPSVQASLLRVVHERVVGELSIAGCRVIAAANPVDQAAGGWDMAPATANRWCHLDFEADLESWSAGQLVNWGEQSTQELAATSSLVVAYINTRPNVLSDCPKDTENNQRGWPSPRAWSAVCSALATLDSETAVKALLTPVGRRLVSGLIGSPAANEFIAWAADQDLPKPEDLLSGKSKIPDRADRARAAVEGAISYALYNKNYYTQVWSLISKTRNDVKLSLGRLFLRAAAQSSQDVGAPSGFDDLFKTVVGIGAVKMTAKTRFERKFG